MFVWNIDVEENKVETHLYLDHFPGTADALYVSSCFIVVETRAAGGQWIVVINKDGGIVRKLGSFEDCRILFNLNRIFANIYGETYEDDVLMFDLKELVKSSTTGLFYKLLDYIKFKDLVHNVSIAGGDDYGFVITKTFISRVEVVIDGVGSWCVMMKKLNFLPID